MSRPVHHGIVFSQSYVVGPWRLYFNVGAALDRLRSLTLDVHCLGAMIRTSLPDDTDNGAHWDPVNSFEVVSYYAVGIVTCLEWHARSRLADLFSYRPVALDADDLKPLANTNLMSQMISTNMSAPQLVAGMRNVSSRQKYLDVFRRVYDALGIDEKPEAIVAALNTADIEGNEIPVNGIEMLDSIFDYRNELVHEIGPSHVGAASQRDALHPDVAADWCNFAERCMLALEKPITETATDDFPNKLNEHGHSTGEIERLDRKIVELEQAVSEKVRQRGAWEKEWEVALTASRHAAEANQGFHGFALFMRLFPNTMDAERSMRAGRISYLEALLQGLGVSA